MPDPRTGPLRQAGTIQTAAPGLIVAGLAVVGLMIVVFASVERDREGVLGSAIGAGVGLLNLAVGYVVMRWALRRDMKMALRTLVGGFFVRLVVVAGLMVVFQRTGAADPGAFGLTFLVFFFVYLGLEVFLVERSID